MVNNSFPCALPLQVITRVASQRIADYAFKFAVENDRRLVTAVHKATVQCVGRGGCAAYAATASPPLPAAQEARGRALPRVLPRGGQALPEHRVQGDGARWRKQAGLLPCLQLAPALLRARLPPRQMIDNAMLNMTLRPEDRRLFDVMVCRPAPPPPRCRSHAPPPPILPPLQVMPNLYGDIASDLGAGLIGGLGLTPSGYVREE